MATAKKLPSGQWRVLAYDYTDENKKRHYKSFTAPTKKEAEFMAAEYALTKKEVKKDSLTLSEAMQNYIDSRSEVLSVGTIREYRRSLKCDLKNLMDTDIYKLTQEMIQKEINREATTHSPKSVRNMHGLLSAVLKFYRPDFALNTSLPQKVPPKLYIPTDDDVRKVLDLAKDDEDMEIAILLAAFGPMRRSEICGLEAGDIKGNVVHVQRAVVMDENKEWVTKTTKSVAGNRFIPFPDFVIKKIKKRKGRIVNLLPYQITNNFVDLLEASDLPHFRFHDLRHYCASIQHAMGIPDAYIMQRGGWGSDSVLKQVYRHALSDQEIKMNQIANDHFNKIMQHEMQHKKEKPQ